MPQIYEIPGVGLFEFEDDRTPEDIAQEIENDIIPNADMDNPDPEAVRAAPHLFPDIDRGSFFGGLESGAERLGRAPEAAGAAVGRSQEELDDLKGQMAEDQEKQKYRASLDDVTGAWDKGNYLEAAGTLFGDVLPQTLGESIPDMGIIGAGSIGGALAGAKYGATAAALIPVPGARIAGAIIGGAFAGLPTFFGMNVERQIQERNITDPNEIETLQAGGAALAQGALEGLIYPVLGWLPGVNGMAAKSVSDLMRVGTSKLMAPEMIGVVSKKALAGGATEAITEVGQQALERAQAGLELNDAEGKALKEYTEAAVLGGLLGVGFGGAGGTYSNYSTNRSIKQTEQLARLQSGDRAWRLHQQDLLAEQFETVENADGGYDVLRHIPEETLESINEPPLTPNEDGEFVERDATVEEVEDVLVQEGKEEARSDFDKYGVGTDVAEEKAQNIRNNMGEEAAAAYEAEYQRLIDAAVAARQGKEAAPTPAPAPTSEVVSTHDTEIEANMFVNRYSKAPIGTPLEELQDRDVTAQDYAEYQTRRTADGMYVTDEMKGRVQEALRDPNERRRMAAAGINVDIVDSIDSYFEEQGKDAVATSGTKEGAVEGNLILLAIDAGIENATANFAGAKYLPEAQREKHLTNYLGGVLSHEHIHALRKLGKKEGVNEGAFSTTDWGILKTYATDHRRADGQTNLERVTATHSDLLKEEGLTGEKLEDALTEEAVAEAFRDWALDPANVTGKPASLFKRTVKTISALGSVFRKAGVRSADDVFQSIESGTTDVDGRVAETGETKMSLAITPEIQKAYDRAEAAGTKADQQVTEGGHNYTPQQKAAQTRAERALGQAIRDAYPGIDSQGVIDIRTRLQNDEPQFSVHKAKKIGDKNYEYRGYEVFNSGPDTWSITAPGESGAADATNTLWQAKAHIDSVEDTGEPNLTGEDKFSVAAPLDEDGIVEVYNDWGSHLLETEYTQTGVRLVKTVDRYGNPKKVRKVFKPGTTEQEIMDWLGVLPPADDIKFATAYHGGPNQWAEEPGFKHGRPNLKYLGSGEGAHVYGWGFYTGEAKGVGQNYVNAGAPSLRFDVVSAIHHLRDGVNLPYGDGPSQAVDIIKNNPRMLKRTLESATTDVDGMGAIVNEVTDLLNDKGVLYKLDVPNSAVAKFMDWDLPVGDQPKHIRDIFLPIIAELRNGIDQFRAASSRKERLRRSSPNNRLTGEDIYKLLENYATADFDVQGDIGRTISEMSKPEPGATGEGRWGTDEKRGVSLYLKSRGIPGLQFKDQDSRFGNNVGVTFNGNRPDSRFPVEGMASDRLQNHSIVLEAEGAPHGPNEAVESALEEAQYTAENHKEPFVRSKEAEVVDFLKNFANDPGSVEFTDITTRNYVIWDQDTLNKTAILERNNTAPQFSVSNAEFYAQQKQEAKAATQDYVVDVRRPGKATIQRPFSAENEAHAQTQAGNRGSTLWRGASEVTNLRTKAQFEREKAQKRYAADVHLLDGTVVTRRFDARNDAEAKRLAAASPNLHQGATAVTNIRMDDPTLDEDLDAPSFSIRKTVRDLSKNEREKAQTIIPMQRSVHPSLDNVRGTAWINGEPLPIVMLYGHQKDNGDGFGFVHIKDKIERFGSVGEMGRILNQMLTNSADQNDAYIRMKPYTEPNAKFPHKNDFRMSWMNKDTKEIYKLGLEKYTHHDGNKYAAITTFFPDAEPIQDEWRQGRAQFAVADSTNVVYDTSKGDRDDKGRTRRDDRLAGQSGAIAPLRGVPEIEGATGPLAGINELAGRYARGRGARHRRQGEYVELDEDRATRIAQAFEEMEDNINAPGVRGAYSDLIRQVGEQYQLLIADGYTFTFMDPNNDPYEGNGWNSMRDLRENKHMAIFPTDAGYGQGSGLPPAQQNPMMKVTDIQIPNAEGVMVHMLANDVFRAVHDVFGHGTEGAGFRARGEENAWQSHANMFTGRALGALTSETRGQNSWLNYGPHGEINRTAKIGDTVFADQKVGLMPEWTWTEGRDPGKALPINEDGTVTLTHFSKTKGLYETDPAFYGTGLEGEEGARKSAYPAEFIPRTYFGIDVGGEGGYVSEFSPDAARYASRIDAAALYDMDMDPDGLRAGALEQSITNRKADGSHLYDQSKAKTLHEKAIRDAGYEGYYSRANQGMTAAVFGKQEVSRFSIAPKPSQVDMRIRQAVFENEARVRAEREGISFEEAMAKQETEEEAGKLSFSIARAQDYLRDNANDLGLSPELLTRVNPIYQPGVLPADRLPSNKEGARWLERRFDGEAIEDLTAVFTPEQIEEIATMMAAEVQLGLQNSGNAFDWYSGALDRALDVISIKYPMLTDDAAAADAGFGSAANSRFAFTYIMAVTSQNLDVSANSVATDKAFGAMVKRVKDGKYDMLGSWGTGDKQKAMAKNFKKFGPILKAMPGATFADKLTGMDQLFRQSRTVKEWVALMKEKGIPYTAPSQTAVDAVVYGSSLLGPKIGNGFWQNLNGNYSPLTIDLWMRRTWGRLTGKSIGNPDALPGQRDRFKRAVIRSRSRNQGAEDHVEAAMAEVRLIEWYIDQTSASEFPTKKAFNEETRQLKADLKEAQEVTADLRGIKVPEPWRPEYGTDQDAMLAYAKRALSVWNQEYARLKKASNSKDVPPELQPTWARAAKTIVTNLGKPLDQVANGTQRKQIEAAGARALEILASRGINMTTADMQAVLWYPEKELWGALTTELATDEDGIPVVTTSSLNESYDTAFTRILEKQNEVQGTEGDRSGGTGSGAVTGQDAGPQRSKGTKGTGGTGEGPSGRGQKFSVANVAALGPSTAQERTLWQKIKRETKKQLAPGGLLHEIAYALKTERDGFFNDQSSVVEWTLTHYARAVKKVYGKYVPQLSEDQLKELDDVLHGGAIPAGMSVEMKTAMLRMRQDIDNMSGEYLKIIRADIAQLRAEGNEDAALRAEMLERTFDNNLGRYVTRSYQVFDDPAWHTKIPVDVQQAAMRYLTAQYNGDVAKAEHVYSVITQGEATAFSSMEALIKESTLGAKDLSILMKRNEDLAPEIRALMGENTDPQLNYARSMLKMSRLIGNTNFLNEIKRLGVGEFLYDEKAGPVPPEANHRIAGEKSDVLSPLNGLWAHPDTVKAFEDALNKNNITGLVGKLIGINGTIKWGKIVLSSATQIRNFVSNISNLIATGSFRPEAVPVAWDTMRAYMLTLDGKDREYYRELVRLGVMLDTPNAGQLKDLMDNGGNEMWGAIEHSLKKNLGENVDVPIEKLRTFKTIIDKLYRAGDEFWKIIGFESQLADYMAAKNMTRAEAAPIVAARVRRTMFTYSQTGSGMKWLGRWPVVGPFVSFSSESVRSTIEGVKMIQEDYADPQLRHLARRRAVGMAVAHSWMFGLAAVSASMYGVDDEELEAIRMLGSTWSENANLMVVGREEDGTLITLDLSYLDMFNIWHRPITAIMRDQPIEEGLKDAVMETLKPFFGPDIAIQNVGELALNQKISGGRVYNPDAPAGDISKDVGDHIFKGLGPGVGQNIRRIMKALDGQRSPSGKVYDLKTELMATAGFRASVFDPKLALNFRVNDFKEGLSNATSYLYGVAGDVNPRDEDELFSAFENANKMRTRAYEDFAKLVNAARNAGVSDRDIRQVLRAANVDKKYSAALARGKEIPKWKLATSFLRGNIKRAKILLGREVSRDLQTRRRTVRKIARSSQ